MTTSMSAAHTPGPWRTEEPDDLEFTPFEGCYRPRYFIAVVAGAARCRAGTVDDGVCHHDDGTFHQDVDFATDDVAFLAANCPDARPDVMTANAQLIAAAPELYKALRECENHLLGLSILSPKVRKALVRAALAKAEGK